MPRLCLIAFNIAQPFLISDAIGFIQGSKAKQPDDKGYGLIGAFAFVYIGAAVSGVCVAGKCTNGNRSQRDGINI